MRFLEEIQSQIEKRQYEQEALKEAENIFETFLQKLDSEKILDKIIDWQKNKKLTLFDRVIKNENLKNTYGVSIDVNKQNNKDLKYYPEIYKINFNHKISEKEDLEEENNKKQEILKQLTKEAFLKELDNNEVKHGFKFSELDKIKMWQMFLKECKQFLLSNIAMHESKGEDKVFEAFRTEVDKDNSNKTCRVHLFIKTTPLKNNKFEYKFSIKPYHFQTRNIDQYQKNELKVPKEEYERDWYREKIDKYIKDFKDNFLEELKSFEYAFPINEKKEKENLIKEFEKAVEENKEEFLFKLLNSHRCEYMKIFENKSTKTAVYFKKTYHIDFYYDINKISVEFLIVSPFEKNYVE